MLELFARLQRGWRSETWRSRIICSLFLACVLLPSGWGFLALAAGTAAPAGATVKPAPTTTQADVNALKAQIDSLKDHADALMEREEDLKWILGFILGAAALFAFAQGASTWFSAESFNKQAEDSLGRAKESETSARNILAEIGKSADKAAKDIERQAAELQVKYPLFSDEEERRKQALDDLRRIFPDEAFNWQRDDYENMPVFERQKLLSIERFISYEIAGRQDPDEIYAGRLRRLARFYWSKFIYERKHGSGNYADLDHAEYLVDLAARRIGAAFYLLNDLGNIYIERYRAFDTAVPSERRTTEYEAQLKMILGDAKKKFVESVDAQEVQLRAYFNLAYVDCRLRDSGEDRELGLRKAIQDLREGLKLRPGAEYPNWENEPVKEYYGSALYNLACYYARLVPLYDGKPLRRMAALKACEAVLRKTAKIGMATPEDVAADFDKESGDIYPILKNAAPEVRNRFENLRRNILAASSRNATEASTQK